MNIAPALIAIAVVAMSGCSRNAAPSRSSSAAVSQPATSDTIRPAQNGVTAQPEVDAMSLYRTAQQLMKAGKREEGYATAKKAMKQFIAEKNNLRWMLLEAIDLEDRRIDVHFNMGPSERRPPEIGIVKPLSFRVWSKGENHALLDIIDFEIGVIDGEQSTAALGQDRGSIHATLEMLPVDASYEVVRKAVLEMAAKTGKH